MKMLEQVAISTAMILEKIGEMMTEKAYIAHAATHKGGGHSEEQAKLQWAEWEKSAQSTDWPPHDYDGVEGSKEKVFRLWVKTSDQLKFQNMEQRNKHMQLSSQAVKKATDSDMDRAMHALSNNHDHIGGKMACMIQRASELAKFSGDAAYDGATQQVGDIESLEVPEEDESEGDEAMVEEVEEPPIKKQKWFDYDKQVTKAQKTLTLMVQNFLDKFKEKLKET